MTKFIESVKYGFNVMGIPEITFVLLVTLWSLVLLVVTFVQWPLLTTIVFVSLLTMIFILSRVAKLLKKWARRD